MSRARSWSRMALGWTGRAVALLPAVLVESVLRVAILNLAQTTGELVRIADRRCLSVDADITNSAAIITAAESLEVGVPGLEPGTSCSQSRRASQLRHTPQYRDGKSARSQYNRPGIVGPSSMEPGPAHQTRNS